MQQSRFGENEHDPRRLGDSGADPYEGLRLPGGQGDGRNGEFGFVPGTGRGPRPGEGQEMMPIIGPDGKPIENFFNPMVRAPLMDGGGERNPDDIQRDQNVFYNEEELERQRRQRV